MSCMESRRPCLRYYLAVICKRLIKYSMLPAFTPGMPSPCVKKLRDAWTNALPRYLRIIKSRYGFYAIFYGSLCTSGHAAVHALSAKRRPSACFSRGLAFRSMPVCF